MSTAFWVECVVMIAVSIAGGFFGYAVGHERGQAGRRRTDDRR